MIIAVGVLTAMLWMIFSPLPKLRTRTALEAYGGSVLSVQEMAGFTRGVLNVEKERRQCRWLSRKNKSLR